MSSFYTLAVCIFVFTSILASIFACVVAAEDTFQEVRSACLAAGTIAGRIGATGLSEWADRRGCAALLTAIVAISSSV